MAMDEALLESAAADPSTAIFRTYGWSAPTLSLGYFQAAAEAESDPRWRGVPLVRRPTGGGALWHEHELTYALIVPRSHPLARRAADLYRAVHGAIAGAVRALGGPAGRRGAAGGENGRNRPFLCFTDRDPEDIVLQGAKIVGSAQRRRSGAVLQHGSLLLSRSAKTPELPGLGDLAEVPIAPLFWVTRLRDVIPTALALSPHDHDFTAAERRRAADLEGSVYRNPAWTRRR